MLKTLNFDIIHNGNAYLVLSFFFSFIGILNYKKKKRKKKLMYA